MGMNEANELFPDVVHHPELDIIDIGETPELFYDMTGPLYWANLLAHEDIVVNQGGSWSGKTYAIMQVLFTIAMMRENYVIDVISNTVTKLKDDAMLIAVSIIESEPKLRAHIKSFNATDRVHHFYNGTRISFKSFENEEQAKGGKRHILYVNEATRVTYKIFFEAQLRTLVRTFIDYNPTAQFYVHDKVIANKLEYPSIKVIRSWHVHNRFLPQTMRDRLERIQDKELWKVYARGLTGLLKGTVYTGWVELDDFPWSDGVIWYFDWGYTNDPTAGGKIKLNPPGLDLDYAVKEICYSPGIPPGVLKQLLDSHGYKEGQIVYCDHDEAMIRELRLLGIAAFPFIKGPGSILSGILFLKNKRVGYVKSDNIKEELKRYRFVEIDDVLTNQPVDEYNHHMDGIRSSTHTNLLRTGE